MQTRWVLSFCIKYEEGVSLAELALLMPFFLLLLFGAVDFGRAYYLTIEVSGAAHAGADYGSQNWGDTSGIRTAALNDAPDVPSLNVATPTYGCECSDGTSSSVSCTAVPTCTTNVVNWVRVQASATYTPLFPWPGIPSSMSISQSAKMRSGLH